MKLILNVNPAPPALTSDQIKQFLNIQIDNSSLSNIQITY